MFAVAALAQTYRILRLYKVTKQYVKEWNRVLKINFTVLPSTIFSEYFYYS